jgi:HSP20 family protein
MSKAPLMPLVSEGLRSRIVTAVKNAYINANQRASPQYLDGLCRDGAAVSAWTAMIPSCRRRKPISKISVWWLRLGIQIKRIKPARSQQNGRHKRMHLTLSSVMALRDLLAAGIAAIRIELDQGAPALDQTSSTRDLDGGLMMVKRSYTAGRLPQAYAPLRRFGEKVADWFALKADAAMAEKSTRSASNCRVSGPPTSTSWYRTAPSPFKEKRFDLEEAGRTYFYGAFQRSFRLAPASGPDRIDAASRNGLLRLSISKLRRTVADSKKIQVRTE